MTTKIFVIVAAGAVIVLIIGGILMFGHSNNDKSAATNSGASPAASSTPAPAGKLVSTDSVVGTGAEAKADSTVTVKYTGKLANGTVFDSTDKHGGQPATFPLNGVIKGWQQGIPGMKVGGKRTLVIPPDLAYGASGTPDGSIPPNSTLTFDIEMIDVK